MTIYVDITQLEISRANTGIQRVVKEFINRAAIATNIKYKFTILDENNKYAYILDNSEIKDFLLNIKEYKFTKDEKIDILNYSPSSPTAFFDLDSVWNTRFQRDKLYPVLKQNGFLIYNFIYDLTPIILPEFAHDETARNFRTFLNAVYSYSDMVMFDSFSAQSDFIDVKNRYQVTRDIPTRVVGLGSDFSKIHEQLEDTTYQDILGKKYILFVGTIEPRKSQDKILEAFEELSAKYSDLNLVIIGKKGWKIDHVIQYMQTHPLKDKKLFWLNDIDDNTLKYFYENAFLVTYLSKYEGYGLPIAESLSYGNITITSKNSSMYEVGKNIADYIVYDSLNELKGLISLYCEDEELYKAKKLYIKENFKTTSWNQFYNSIEDIFTNYEKSVALKKYHLKTLQFVFISIDKYNLEGTIKSIDKYVDFVQEYIIVTAPKYIDTFLNIESKNKITIIDETTILGQYAQNFHKRDHVSKNWLLRASLLNIETLADEFIMLDDDNRVLKNITLDKFIASDGSYNAYYFYYMLEWHYQNSDYDEGQQHMKSILSEENYEMLMYSSHAPQIINKSIFKEVVDKFFDVGLNTPIDEWSTYFNYGTSRYPCLFNKKLFETLSWPATPTDWETMMVPKEYTFENYYKSLYDSGFLSETDTYEQKVEKKRQQLSPYLKSKQMFEENKDILSKNNMVHETLLFKKDAIKIFLSNFPYFIVVEKVSDMKIRLNLKLLNPKLKALNLAIVLFLDGRYRTLTDIKTKNNAYEEGIVEVPIIAHGLDEGTYEIGLNIMLNNEYIFPTLSPYTAKLIVIKDKNQAEVLGNPEIIEPEEPKVDDPDSLEGLKQKIKAIPILGWVLRLSYNMLRLNNTKHRVYTHQLAIEELQRITEELHRENQHLQQYTLIQQHTLNESKRMIEDLRNENEYFKQELQKYESKSEAIHNKVDRMIAIENKVENIIAKEISFQSDSFQQRLDQFIFDAKIDLGLKKRDDEKH